MNMRVFTARNSWFLKGLGHKAIIRTAKETSSDPENDREAQSKTDDNRAASSERADTGKSKAADQAAKKGEKNTSESGAQNGHEKADKSNEELFRVRASRIVDLFPNELVIREKNITVVKRDLLFSQTETWPIEDIGEVTLVDTPLYSRLHLSGKFPEHKLDLKGIPKNKAMKAKEIIDGLVLEDQEQVDLPEDSPPDKHRKMLAEAGKLPEGIGPSHK